MFLDEEAAKKFIKSGNCPSIPAGLNYRITKSRVERIGEPISKIPGAFKALDRRNFSSNTNFDDLKQLDLTALSDKVRTSIDNKAINLTNIKTKCPITNLSDNILSVIDDFGNSLCLHFPSLSSYYGKVFKKASIASIYSMHNPLLITDKNGTKVVAVKYFPTKLMLDITAPIEFPNKNTTAIEENMYHNDTALFRFYAYTEY